MTFLERLPTPAKLLLFMSLALLPIGIALVWSASNSLRDAGRNLHAVADDQAQTSATAIESLIARNALALRLTGNAVLRTPTPSACDEARRTLAIAPGVARSFELEDVDGHAICAIGDFENLDAVINVAPGDIALWIAPDEQSLFLRTGVNGGSATGRLSIDDLRAALDGSRKGTTLARLEDGRRSMTLIGPDRNTLPSGTVTGAHRAQLTVGNGRLTALFDRSIPSITALEKLVILLPVVMWVLAALISWLLVHRFLIGPLRRLQRAVTDFQPGAELSLPTDLGHATEIRELGEAFARAVDRIDESEREMAVALEGQRRLVREVHHRVKNNLQVVASMLSIHGRNAAGPEARSAYASIGRRVDALSVVHRNHYAELEENRGIALRPMLSELAQGLRATAPDPTKAIQIDLELDHASTTQDVAVAVAFLVTEVVEHAILNGKAGDPVEVILRRTSPLTARLTLSAKSLLEQDEKSSDREQFERIVTALARQLRSPLERKLASYSVDLPIFPAA